MISVKNLYLLMISRGLTDGLEAKITASRDAGRLTEDEYTMLTEKLAGDQEGQN